MVTKNKTAPRVAKKKAVKGVQVVSVETVLILRTCDKNLKSHGGFQWPESGPVSCSDWDPKPICGFGLHGLLWGEGNGELLNWDESARWLVVEVFASDIVEVTQDGGGKVKFPKGTVVYSGNREGATDLIATRRRGAIVGATMKTDANNAVALAGYRGTATAGECGTATAGNGGTATAGNGGTATAGECGTATAGNGGTATAGNGGTATAGNGGTATAGNGGTATAGEFGTLNIRWWDGKRYRLAEFVVGEDGIEANVPYRCEGGKPVKVVE